MEPDPPTAVERHSAQRLPVAIIGGGLSGLTLARVLLAAGQPVQVFDKGRGPGGRLSSRRIETALGDARFDHGTSMIASGDRSARKALEALAGVERIGGWTGRLVRIDADGITPVPADEWYVGQPGMNEIIRGLADGVPVQWGLKIDSVTGSAGAIFLIDEKRKRHGPYAAAAIATPAEQVADLVQGIAPELARQARDARSEPCWAAMFAFASPITAPFDAARLDNPTLAWASRETSKPGRSGPDAWVVHASASWSRRHLERQGDAVASDLLAAFHKVIGDDPHPMAKAAHRWRYARVAVAADTPFFWDPERGIGCCGDWRIGPNIEDAWSSGNLLGEAMPADLARITRVA